MPDFASESLRDMKETTGTVTMLDGTLPNDFEYLRHAVRPSSKVNVPKVTNTTIMTIVAYYNRLDAMELCLKSLMSSLQFFIPSFALNFCCKMFSSIPSTRLPR